MTGYDSNDEIQYIKRILEEEEESDHKILTAIVVAVSCLHKRRRPNYHVCDRIEWDNHVHQLTLEGGKKLAGSIECRTPPSRSYVHLLIQ